MPLTLRGEHGEQARETAAFVERLRAAIERPGRDLRRALHLRARRRRRRARGRAPALELPRVAERAPLSDDRAGPRPDPPPAYVAVVCARRSRRSRSASRSPPRCRTCITTRRAPPPPPPPPKPFRIVFPEGFTRAQMAERVGVVAKIAERESGKAACGSRARRYLAATATARRPVLRPRRADEPRGLPLPGDLRLPRDDDLAAARRATRSQAFCRNWRTVDLAYARSKNLTPYDVLKIASMVEKEAVVAGRAAARSPP